MGHTAVNARGSASDRGDMRRKEGIKSLEWGSGWDEGADSPCQLYENRTASRIDQFESHRRRRVISRASAKVMAGRRWSGGAPTSTYPRREAMQGRFGSERLHGRHHGLDILGGR